MPKKYAMIGNTASQIKKRYAMVDSTANKVKKEYAMVDNTANLVYTADMVIIGDNAEYTEGWSVIYGNPDDNSHWLNAEGTAGSLTYQSLLNMQCISSYGNHSGAINVCSDAPIDFTDWNNISITFQINASATNNNQPRYYLSLVRNRTDYIFQPGTAGNSARLTPITNGDFGGWNATDDGYNVTITKDNLDISNITGSYYINFYAYADNGEPERLPVTANWSVVNLTLS